MFSQFLCKHANTHAHTQARAHTHAHTQQKIHIVMIKIDCSAFSMAIKARSRTNKMMIFTFCRLPAQSTDKQFSRKSKNIRRPYFINSRSQQWCTHKNIQRVFEIVDGKHLDNTKKNFKLKDRMQISMERHIFVGLCLYPCARMYVCVQFQNGDSCERSDSVYVSSAECVCTSLVQEQSSKVARDGI